MDADEPAYPIITPDMTVVGSGGLTKRELFAAMAMQGMYGDAQREGTPGQRAIAAVFAADALITELSKEQP